MNFIKDLKVKARSFLSHARPSPLFVGIVAAGVIVGLQQLEQYVTGYAKRYESMMSAYEAYMSNGDMEALLNAAQGSQMSFVQGALSVLLQLMVLMVTVGVIIYAFSVIRYRQGSYGNLLDGLPVLMCVLVYQLLSGLFIFLWSLLLVVPGIMAAYSYRMGLYLLLDHPELTPGQCLKLSRKMMQGHRMELFLLDVSFLGWTAGLYVVSMGMSVAGMGLGGVILTLPLQAFVLMYVQFTEFLFYERLLGVEYEPLTPSEPNLPQ